MKTRRGIYLDLEESTYIYKIEGLTLYFSSAFYMQKFIETYREYSTTIERKVKEKYKVYIDLSLYLAFSLYKKIEKRGFKVLYKGEPVAKNSIFIGRFWE